MSRATRPQSQVFRKTRSIHGLLLAGATMAVALAQTGGVNAAEKQIVIYSDQAQVLKVNGEPATAIVGNPMYADASVQRGMIVLQGRHFGTTNLVVLDARGKELTNLLVTVQQTPTSRVTMFKAGESFTYTCGSDNCETTLEVGDNKDHFANIEKEMSGKYGMAAQESKAK